MRPIWAVVITIAALPAWWELIGLAGGFVPLVLAVDGFWLVLVMPVALALCLLGRRRLGRWTSILFGVQAGVLVLVGLTLPNEWPLPDSSGVGYKAAIAVVLGDAYIPAGQAAVLRVVAYTLAVAWLLLIPVIGLFAWSLESRHAAVAA